MSVRTAQMADQNWKQSDATESAVARGRVRAAYKYCAQENGVACNNPPKVRPVLAEMRMRPREFKKSVSCKSWQIGWRIYLVGDLLQASSWEYIGGAYCRL
jgi:hypothetical protein